MALVKQGARTVLGTLIRNSVPPALLEAAKRLRNWTQPAPAVTAETIYVSAPATIAAARAAGLSVYDYVLQLWDRPPSIIEKLHSLGVISPVLKIIVEIGPGTGVFTEQTLKYCRPQRYQIYEIDRDWSEWLAKTYPVEDCHADGKSLARTKSSV